MNPFKCKMFHEYSHFALNWKNYKEKNGDGSAPSQED